MNASKGALVALIAAWLTEKVSLLGTVATLAVALVAFAWAQSLEDRI